MYPDEETLMEVGRIAIAAGRLDAELGSLWWHLAPDLVDETHARKAPASRVRSKIAELASRRLSADFSDPLLNFVIEVAGAQTQRNEALHSRWLLRGRDAMRPVSEYLQLDEGDRAAYLDEWDRKARSSEGWRRQPNDSLDLVEPHGLDDLQAIERRLALITEVANQWCFTIASMREVGSPPGWRGPPESRRGPQPPPPRAITGPKAFALMTEQLQRMRGEPNVDQEAPPQS